MIIFVYGTTGELIKLAPVMRRLRDRDEPYISISTHQQATQILPMCDDFGLPAPDVVLWGGLRGNDLSRTWEIPAWLSLLMARFLWRLPTLRRRLSGAGRNVLVVHGDTMTTVVGAVMGRLLRIPVAHVEAGLRSHDWRHPFPEEVNRRITGRLATVHFAPGKTAAANLRRAPGEVFDIGGNTVFDSLHLAAERAHLLPEGLVPGDRFGVVSIHRFELLAQPDRLRGLLEVLAEEARRTRLLFIDHPVTAAKVDDPELRRFFDGDRFRRVPRLSYPQFVGLLKRSEYLVTDSGGAQEECFYLNHPCLVHRMATERDEGLEHNVVLSRFDLGVVRAFLADPGRYRAPVPVQLDSPSDFVAEELVRRVRGVAG